MLTLEDRLQTVKSLSLCTETAECVFWSAGENSTGVAAASPGRESRADCLGSLRAVLVLDAVQMCFCPDQDGIIEDRR